MKAGGEKVHAAFKELKEALCVRFQEKCGNEPGEVGKCHVLKGFVSPAARVWPFFLGLGKPLKSFYPPEM